MSDFVLVDLTSQAWAFAHCVEGWKPDDILAWLAQHGEVKKLPNINGSHTYLFRSVVGIRTGFVFDENGELLLIGDHTIYKPSAPR